MSNINNNNNININNNNSQLHDGIHQSVFMSSMVPNPAKDLPLCWEQHSKLLPGVDQYKANDIALWNTTRVSEFVSTLPGCKEQAQMFVDEVGSQPGCKKQAQMFVNEVGSQPGCKEQAQMFVDEVGSQLSAGM